MACGETFSTNPTTRRGRRSCSLQRALSAAPRLTRATTKRPSLSRSAAEDAHEATLDRYDVDVGIIAAAVRVASYTRYIIFAKQLRTTQAPLKGLLTEERTICHLQLYSPLLPHALSY